MTEFAERGGANLERFISQAELEQRIPSRGYVVDDLEKTFRSDDAHFAEELPDGGIILTTSFSEGGLLDRDGRLLADLAERLGEGYEVDHVEARRWVSPGGKKPLSLLGPERLKPAISVSSHFNPDGKMISYQLYRSAFSGEPIEKADFDSLLQGAFPTDELWPLKRASQLLRGGDNTLDLLDEDWKNVQRSRLADFSIVANAVIARVAYDNGIPWLYRNHDMTKNYRIGDIHDHNLPEVIEQLLAEVDMAVYSNQPTTHDGLGLKIYSHAQGQLREFPNMVNGILLTNWFETGENLLNQSQVDDLARWINTLTLHKGARKRFPELIAFAEEISGYTELEY